MPHLRLNKKRNIRWPRKKVTVAALVIVFVVFLCLFVFFFSRPDNIRTIATVTTDIQYCNSTDHGQTLDFYRPNNQGNADVPLIVYIHGGGWQKGDKNNNLIRNYLPQFIKKGIAVASLNYRLHSSHPYPDQNEDIGCALAYLDAQAGQLHINKEKILYFGDSAGGELAAFAALNIPYQNYDYEAPAGVIDFYGVSDFSTIVNGGNPDLNARRYIGSKSNKVISEASPVTYVTKSAPRFLFIHGTRDLVVPISQSLSFYNLLIKESIDAEYITVPNAGHAFVGPELGDARYKIIQDNMNSFIKETIGY